MFRDEIAAQRMADLCREAAKQRLLRELRASRKPTLHRGRIWERLSIRRPRPAFITRIPPAGPVAADSGKAAVHRAC
jgi:hypothetical protein